VKECFELWQNGFLKTKKEKEKEGNWQKELKPTVTVHFTSCICER